MRVLFVSFNVAILASLFSAAVFPAAAQPAAAVTSAPVYVPDTTHQNDPLPNDVIAWDATTKSVDATNGQDFAHFIFAFTNIAKRINLGQVTNVTSVTNFTIITNSGFWSVFSGQKYTATATVITNTRVAT